jgi:hypothetical protein
MPFEGKRSPRMREARTTEYGSSAGFSLLPFPRITFLSAVLVLAGIGVPQMGIRKCLVKYPGICSCKQIKPDDIRQKTPHQH